MTNEDLELQSLIRKKTKEMLKKISRPSTTPKQKDPLAVVRPHLVDRADEVLETALKQEPEISKKIVEALAKMVESGQIRDTINGGQLLWVLRSLGVDLRIETSIKVMRDGKLVPLTERLARGEE